MIPKVNKGSSVGNAGRVEVQIELSLGLLEVAMVIFETKGLTILTEAVCNKNSLQSDARPLCRQPCTSDECNLFLTRNCWQIPPPVRIATEVT